MIAEKVEEREGGLIYPRRYWLVVSSLRTAERTEVRVSGRWFVDDVEIRGPV